MPTKKKQDKTVFGAPVIVTEIKTLKGDKSLKITLHTARETNAEEMTALFRFRDVDSYMLLAADLHKASLVNIPDITPDFKGERTPSQRLRAVLYRLWEQHIDQSGSDMAFEVYYRSRVDEIIDRIKDKLN